MSNIPSSPSTCAACNQTVNCDFLLYANATNLQPNQKLAPDNEIIGLSVSSFLPFHKVLGTCSLFRQISRAFIGTAVLSIVMAFLLLIDEVRLLQRPFGPPQDTKSE